MQQQQQQQQQADHRKRRNVAIGAIALLVSWTVVATFCVCLYLLVRPVPPAYDSLLRMRMVTLNQTMWSLTTQTELLNGELSEVANAFVSLADLIQNNDAVLYNSTERTRVGLIMLLKYLQQTSGGG